jgi:hypothetical protein
MQQIRHSMDSHVSLFRKLALSLPNAIESAHMGHPDFPLNDRIFATLSAQSKGRGVLKLTSQQQDSFIREMPDVFEVIPGGWGRMGMTFVVLGRANAAILEGALTTAYNNVKSRQEDARSKRSQRPGKPKRPRLE